jgi:hypothetical protein
MVSNLHHNPIQSNHQPINPVNPTKEKKKKTTTHTSSLLPRRTQARLNAPNHLLPSHLEIDTKANIPPPFKSYVNGMTTHCFDGVERGSEGLKGAEEGLGRFVMLWVDGWRVGGKREGNEECIFF